ASTHSTTNGDRLTLGGSSGADSIVVNHLDVTSGSGCIAVRGLEKCTVNGGGGNDSLTIGTDLSVDFLYDGGANTDSLVYNATDNADTLTLGAGSISNATITQYQNVETVTINAMGGADAITFSGSVAGTPITLNGGSGNDALSIETTPLSSLLFAGGLTVGE